MRRGSHLVVENKLRGNESARTPATRTLNREARRKARSSSHVPFSRFARPRLLTSNQGDKGSIPAELGWMRCHAGYELPTCFRTSVDFGFCMRDRSNDNFLLPLFCHTPTLKAQGSTVDLWSGFGCGRAAPTYYYTGQWGYTHKRYEWVRRRGTQGDKVKAVV
jgi:hypothetical protein